MRMPCPQLMTTLDLTLMSAQVLNMLMMRACACFMLHAIMTPTFTFMFTQIMFSLVRTLTLHVLMTTFAQPT